MQCECEGFEPCHRTEHFVGHATAVAADRQGFKLESVPCEEEASFDDEAKVCSSCYNGVLL